MKPTFRFLIFLSVLAAIISPQAVHPQETFNEVFLLERNDKILAFSGLQNSWFEKDLRPGETVVKSGHGGNVAVACTTERALAFSAVTGRWTEEGLRIRESVLSITAEGNVATVITNIRALGFSSQSGVWVESKFNIGK